MRPPFTASEPRFWADHGYRSVGSLVPAPNAPSVVEIESLKVFRDLQVLSKVLDAEKLQHGRRSRGACEAPISVHECYNFIQCSSA